MTLRISIPFGYKLADTTLEFDFSELRKDKRFVISEDSDKFPDSEYSKDMQTLPDQRFIDKYFRVLESHLELRRQILEIFHLFTANTFGESKFDISTSWINVLEEGERILPQRYSNCFYSGVLYFGKEYDAEKGCAETKLSNPLKYELSNTINPFRKPQNGLISATESDVYLKPFTGGLYFYPANIIHSSLPHIGSTRYSLGFNFVSNDGIHALESSWNPKWVNYL